MTIGDATRANNYTGPAQPVSQTQRATETGQQQATSQTSAAHEAAQQAAQDSDSVSFRNPDTQSYDLAQDASQTIEQNRLAQNLGQGLSAVRENAELLFGEGNLSPEDLKNQLLQSSESIQGDPQAIESLQEQINQPENQERINEFVTKLNEASNDPEKMRQLIQDMASQLHSLISGLDDGC